MRQIARSTCTSCLSLFRYIWVLITQPYGGPLLTSWWQGQATRTPRNSSPRKICGMKKWQKSQKWPNSQIKILEPTASQKSQVSGFWLQKSQSGNPAQDDLQQHAEAAERR